MRGRPVVTLLGLVILAAGCMERGAGDDGTAAEDARAPATYEETRHLSGQALADALGLEPLDVPRGVPVREDDPRLGACAKGASEEPAGTASTGEAVYCLVGVVDDELQEWDVAMRLAGFAPPCELQVQAFKLSQEAERLAEAGDASAAKDLASEAHDLKVEASRTEGCGERVAEPASH
jgi:hypothetical protein